MSAELTDVIVCTLLMAFGWLIGYLMREVKR